MVDSVPDPDPYVLGPPGSGSVSHKYDPDPSSPTLARRAPDSSSLPPAPPPSLMAPALVPRTEVAHPPLLAPFLPLPMGYGSSYVSSAGSSVGSSAGSFSFSFSGSSSCSFASSPSSSLSSDAQLISSSGRAGSGLRIHSATSDPLLLASV